MQMGIKQDVGHCAMIGNGLKASEYDQSPEASLDEVYKKTEL